MLDNIIRRTALELLVGAVRHPEPKVRDLLAEMFWDLQYIYRFGIPRIPPAEIPFPFPPQPQPDPSPINRLQLHEELLIGLVDFAAGDPDPEPNINNIEGILKNPSIRLAAAKNLLQRLNTATEKLNKEIARLEEQQK